MNIDGARFGWSGPYALLRGLTWCWIGNDGNISEGKMEPALVIKVVTLIQVKERRPCLKEQLVFFFSIVEAVTKHEHEHEAKELKKKLL